DVGLQRSPKYLGSKNSESIFAALRYDDGGAITATYKFDWIKGTNTPEARTVAAINPNDFVGGMLTAILAAQPAGGGRFGPVTLNPSNKRPDAYNNAWTQQGWQKGMGHNLTIDLQASDSLTFKNITAYRKGRVYAPATVAGLDGLEFTPGSVLPYARFAAISFLSGQQVNVADPANAALVAGTITSFAQNFGQQVGSYFAGYGGHGYGRSSQFSNELQANYTSDFVTVTAGLLYYEGKELSSGLPGYRANFSFQPVPTLLPLGGIQDLTNKTVSMAAYAQAEFNITPELGLVLGGRLTRDKKTGGVELGGTFVGDRFGEGEIVGTTFLPYDFKKTKPTYSVGLNYQPTPDILLYGKYSTAFLSGGAVADLAFPPETVKSWEAGIKSDLFDRLVRFNLTGWMADYSNAQAANSGTCCNRPELSVIVLSNGKIEAKGVEAELNIAPLPGLSFGGSVGYTDVKQVGTDPLLSQGRDTRPTNAPKWAGTANVTYVTPALFGDANMLFRLDTTFQTKFRTYPYTDVDTVNPALAPYEFTKGRAIVNGRVALRDVDMGGGGKLEVGLWAKNLLDNKDVLYAFNFAEILMTSSFQPARTYGLDVIVRFNP
ncbi:MAG: TonB-dependent receptor, partial [Burkholderiales bacterium]